jgi:hypothetical protein
MEPEHTENELAVPLRMSISSSYLQMEDNWAVNTNHTWLRTPGNACKNTDSISIYENHEGRCYHFPLLITALALQRDHHLQPNTDYYTSSATRSLYPVHSTVAGLTFEVMKQVTSGCVGLWKIHQALHEARFVWQNAAHCVQNCSGIGRPMPAVFS